MYNNIFSRFSDNARIWIYAFKNALTTSDLELVQGKLKAFIDNWHSHGNEVGGDYTVLYDQFVIIATDYNDVSGCSVDSSVEIFKDLKNNHSLDALDLNQVFYRNIDKIEAISRAEFSSSATRGFIKDHTSVFDTMISTLGELRSGKFEKTVKESWHKVLLRQVA